MYSGYSLLFTQDTIPLTSAYFHFLEITCKKKSNTHNQCGRIQRQQLCSEWVAHMRATAKHNHWMWDSNGRSQSCCTYRHWSWADLSHAQSSSHTHSHMYTYTHSHTHMHTQALTHTHTCTPTLTHTHTVTHTHIHSFTCTHNLCVTKTCLCQMYMWPTAHRRRAESTTLSQCAA